MNFKYCVGSLGSHEVKALKEVLLDRRDDYEDIRYVVDLGLAFEDFFEIRHYMERCEIFL